MFGLLVILTTSFNTIHNFDLVTLTELGTYVTLLYYELYILVTSQTDRKLYNKFQIMLMKDFNEIHSEELIYR